MPEKWNTDFKPAVDAWVEATAAVRPGTRSVMHGKLGDALSLLARRGPDAVSGDGLDLESLHEEVVFGGNANEGIRKIWYGVGLDDASLLMLRMTVDHAKRELILYDVQMVLRVEVEMALQADFPYSS